MVWFLCLVIDVRLWQILTNNFRHTLGLRSGPSDRARRPGLKDRHHATGISPAVQPAERNSQHSWQSFPRR